MSTAKVRVLILMFFVDNVDFHKLLNYNLSYFKG